MTTIEPRPAGAVEATPDELAAAVGVADAVALVRRAVLAMDDARAAHPDDPEGLARLMQVCRIIERDVAAVRRQTEQDAVGHMLAHEREIEVDGLGYVKATRGRSRKVQDIGTVDAAIERHAAYDAETGEARTPQAAAAQAVELMRRTYGAKTPKITQLPALGIEPDDVAEWIDGKPTLMLPPIPN